MRSGERPRGQPLMVLAVLLSSWIGARALAWHLLADTAPLTVTAGAPAELPTAPAFTRLPVHRAPLHEHTAPPPNGQPTLAAPLAAPLPLAPLAPAPLPLSPAPTSLAPAHVTGADKTEWMMLASGHQLLSFAALGMLPVPAEIAAHLRQEPAPAPQSATRFAPLARWSADGWVFVRRGGSPITFPRLSGFGNYGSSQTGAVLRYRLAPADPHRPTLYLRGSGALNGTREQEVALGAAVRPLPGLPVAAMAEVRATRDGLGLRARPAVALVTELPPQRLPLGFTAETYVQGGYVGGRFATAYVDGLVRAERGLVTVAGTDIGAGGGVWGAKQRGAARIDVGPVASVRVRLGDTASARIEADWRFRVAGRAHPDSGPALTLSAGF